MKITFVYPPFEHKKFNENISVVDNEFGCYQPMGLAYAAAIMRQAGAEVRIIDANAEHLSKEETTRRLKEYGPDVVGLDLHSAYVFYDTLPWAGYIKEKIGDKTRIIAGGFNYNLYYKEVMMHPEIDYGLLGPVQNSVNELVSFFNKQSGPETVPGLVYRKDNKLKINPGNKKYLNLDVLPFPARDLLPMEKYYSYISKRKNFTVMLAQIGCPFRCKYCAIALVPHKKRSAEKVFEEILECYNKYGVREIDFFDGTLTADRRMVHNMCDLIIRHKLDLYWSCRTRIDCIDEALIAKMARSGCQRIYYGIESVSNKVLGAVEKDIRPENMEWPII